MTILTPHPPTPAEALAEIEAVIADLRSPTHPQPIDPKAVYRTRDMALFERAIAALTLVREGWTEVERLRERLELTHAYQVIDGEMVKVPAPDGMPDGIECRDETIKLLEARAQAAERENERMRGALGEIARLRTDDFSLSSHQSDIARRALGDQT